MRAGTSNTLISVKLPPLRLVAEAPLFQGHPEFLPDIVQKMVDAREASGVLSKEVAAEARIRANREHDGVDAVAKAFWDMVLPLD